MTNIFLLSALVMFEPTSFAGPVGATKRLVTVEAQGAAQTALRSEFEKLAAKTAEGGKFEASVVPASESQFSRDIILYTPPPGTGKKAFALEYPERGVWTDGRPVTLQVHKNELIVKDGDLGIGNGGTITWSQTGELKMAHYRFGTDVINQEVLYSVVRNGNGYDLKYAVIDTFGKGKPLEFNARILPKDGEVISSIREIDPIERKVRISGTYNGKAFSRVVSLAKEEVRFPLNNPSGRLPPVEAIQ